MRHISGEESLSASLFLYLDGVDGWFEAPGKSARDTDAVDASSIGQKVSLGQRP